MKIVFAGPSIYPSRDIRADCPPELLWRGPAEQGDVAGAVRAGASVIALVDGVYGTVAAVWHKEILYALSEGVEVIGGASMGAIRAVECAAFGMKGFGTVFDDYRCGRIVDDGDIAVLHAPAELDYAPLTETLVDLRATLGTMRADGKVDGSLVDEMLRVAETTFFWQRTIETVVAQVGLPDLQRSAICDLFEENRRSVKRDDALLVIQEALRAIDKRQAPPNWILSPTRSYNRIKGTTLALTLQLLLSFEMRFPCSGLVSASEDRPCEGVGGGDDALGELHGKAADFLDRPADEGRSPTCRSFVFVFFGVMALACDRTAVIMA